MTTDDARRALERIAATWPPAELADLRRMNAAEVRLVLECVHELDATIVVDGRPAAPSNEVAKPEAPPREAVETISTPRPRPRPARLRQVPPEAVALLRRLGSDYTPAQYQLTVDEDGAL